MMMITMRLPFSLARTKVGEFVREPFCGVKIKKQPTPSSHPSTASAALLILLRC